MMEDYPYCKGCSAELRNSKPGDKVHHNGDCYYMWELGLLLRLERAVRSETWKVLGILRELNDCRTYAIGKEV